MKTYFGILDLFEKDLKRRVAEKKKRISVILVFLKQKNCEKFNIIVLFCSILL
jgi:hypothetical protein